MNSFYSSDFAADTIKVVSYINVLRNGLSVYDYSSGPVELDYLLAMMKEDYGDKKEFTCQTKKAVASTFDSVLKPFSDSLDYAFYFVNKSEDKFLFLMLVLHECSGDELSCICYGNVNDPTCAPYVNSMPNVELNYYYCTPSSIRVLEENVFPYAGKVDTAISKFDFLDSSGNSVVFDAELAMWVTRDIRYLTNISTHTDLNCSKIEFAQPC